MTVKEGIAMKGRIRMVRSAQRDISALEGRPHFPAILSDVYNHGR